MDTMLSVFSNTCESSICVDDNDDSCGLQSQVVWDTTDGEEYYILVHAFGSGEEGEFGIELDTFSVSTPVTDDEGNGEDTDEEDDGEDMDETETEPRSLMKRIMCFFRSLVDIILPGDWACAA